MFTQIKTTRLAFQSNFEVAFFVLFLSQSRNKTTRLGRLSSRWQQNGLRLPSWLM